MTLFKDLHLALPIQEALKKLDYETPTPIQAQTIPLVLEGKDVLGIAQTGTGKTAAFCLPILNRLHEQKSQKISKCPKVLVLTPTRELAIQIHQNLEEYGAQLDQRYSVIFGGVSQVKQVREMKQGAHVLVATPGRLLDLIQQRHIDLSKVETFVLDEADRMLDMGFMRDIKKIIPMLPAKRHNLFFSATMPSEIQKLAQTILKDPVKVEVTPPSTTVEMIDQSVMFAEKKEKVGVILHLLKDKSFKKVLVFVGMKHVANRITERLHKNRISAAAIHGNKSQGARQKAIAQFAKGDVRVLVATDIASRGIDIDEITHVINYELPNIPESYVHRIGRTARAGAQGKAISLVCTEEKFDLAQIEKAIKQTIRVDRDQPFHSREVADAPITKAPTKNSRFKGKSSRGGNRTFGASKGKGRPGKSKLVRRSSGKSRSANA